jgi:glyoxylase-like metal-dependent hydrolase (beta-lactamase superfamily II)
MRSNHNTSGDLAMKRKLFLASTLASAALLLAACSTTSTNSAKPAGDVLKNADRAMGSADLKTLRYTANGTGAIFGQAYQPGTVWPQLKISNFVRLHDYNNAALRQDQAISRAEPNGGGAVPLMGQGEQRTVAMLMGTSAWNMVGPAPVASPVALDQRIHDLWTSPHGIIKAALKNNATVTTRNLEGQTINAVSFTEPGRFMATVYINNQGLVARVDSRLSNPVMGDTDVVTEYSDYKDYGGVKFPDRIEQVQGGAMVLDLHVTEVQVNPPADIAVPELVRVAAEKAVAEKAAEGIWFIGGGSHNSVAIEMKDHIMLVESPLYDGRAAAVLAEVKRVIPGKPIRYVVNSHHHFDHAGGLRTAVADGATVVASAKAKPYFERVLANPNRISPDMLAKSNAAVKVEAVDGKRVFTDGARTVELYLIGQSVHADGFIMVYLPAEKLLVQADAYTPSAPNAAPPAVPNANNLNLISNIEGLKLNVERILPLHGRMVPVAELYTTAGRKL